MRRRDFLQSALAAGALAPFGAAAQRPNLPTIGVLLQGSEGIIPQVLADALRNLGYIEGRNVRLEFRSAERDPQRLPGLAADLVSRKVDVIVATITPSVLAAIHATRDIPIVMTYVADPVGMGIVATVARPGGNVTGLSSLALDSAAKQVELLNDAVPDAARFAVLFTEEAKPLLGQIVSAGTARRIVIEPHAVAKPGELDTVFSAMAGHRADGLIVQGSLSSTHVADLALRYRLAAISQHPLFAKQGGLISYYSDPADNARRAAVLIDKILKGAKPADLPVEQPTRFELVINLKTAATLGLTVQPLLLAQATEVIE